jgi:hypothetical protein
MNHLPGSRRNRELEPGDPSAAGLSSGRFTEQQLALLHELTQWWANRRAVEDSPTPLATLIGGVDLRGTATTTGTAAATITFAQPLLSSSGAAFLVLALGIPDPPVVGEVYSIAALCHFYDPPSSGWLSRYTTLGRAPSGTTSTEIRAGVDGGGDPILQIVGVSGLTIDWQVEALRLE